MKRKILALLTIIIFLLSITDGKNQIVPFPKDHSDYEDNVDILFSNTAEMTVKDNHYVNIYLSHNKNTFEIDKKMNSRLDTGFKTAVLYNDYIPTSAVEPFDLNADRKILVNRSGRDIPVYKDLVQTLIHVDTKTAGGEIIGYIHPGDIYSQSRCREGKNVTVRGVFIHGSENNILKGYIDSSPGHLLPDYSWSSYQEDFCYYNSNGKTLSLSSNNVEEIHGKKHYVFTTKKDLDRRNKSGTLLSRLPANTKLAISVEDLSLAGQSYQNYMYFDYYKDGDDWKGIGEHYIDINSKAVNNGGFVNIGLQYGASPRDRAIW